MRLNNYETFYYHNGFASLLDKLNIFHEQLEVDEVKDCVVTLIHVFLSIELMLKMFEVGLINIHLFLLYQLTIFFTFDPSRNIDHILRV